MKRTKSEHAVFMLTRYVKAAKVSLINSLIIITNYSELSPYDKVGLSIFVNDYPNIVRPTDKKTELKII